MASVAFCSKTFHSSWEDFAENQFLHPIKFSKCFFVLNYRRLNFYFSWLFLTCSSANATPTFEGRGGEDLANEISSSLQKAYDILPLNDLCIVPNFSCWKLYVDILILECGGNEPFCWYFSFELLFCTILFLFRFWISGNLYDAISLAVKSALFNTQIPKVKAKYIDGVNVDLQLSDDLFECWKLDVSKAPCLVTLCKVRKHQVFNISFCSYHAKLLFFNNLILDWRILRCWSYSRRGSL